MKYFLSLIALCFLFDVSAQTSMGSWLIGGSAKLQRTAQDYNISTGPGNTKTFTDRQGNVTVSPTVGYFAVNNLMLGIQASESHSWSLGSDGKANSFALGPLVRYYFPLGKFAFFPELAYQLARDKSSYKYIDDFSGTFITVTNKTRKSIFSGGLGAAWFVTPNIGIEGILGYQDTDIKDTNVGDTRVLYYNIGIGFYLPAK